MHKRKRDTTISILGIYPRKNKNYIHRKIWTKMFIAALFRRALQYKQSRFLSIWQVDKQNVVYPCK